MRTCVFCLCSVLPPVGESVHSKSETEWKCHTAERIRDNRVDGVAYTDSRTGIRCLIERAHMVSPNVFLLILNGVSRKHSLDGTDNASKKFVRWGVIRNQQY